MSRGTRDNNQIIRQVVAKGEPAGKRIRDCRLGASYTHYELYR